MVTCHAGAIPIATPNPVIAAPHTRIEAITAAPCRRTRDTHPENTPPRTAPAGIAANSNANASPPSGEPPNRVWAISGNNALGIPNTIAIRSTTNEVSSTGWPRR